MQTPITIEFDSGRAARAVRFRAEEELEAAVAALGVPRGRPTLVVVGGAASLADPDRMRPLFTETLVPLAARLHACVVDGGTASGVMRLLGEARRAAGATFPLVGVAAEGTVAVPGALEATAERAPLDPNHSHFVLVPGTEWGDEVPWLVRVADVLAEGAPSVTVLVEGGDVAWRDVDASILAGRRVVVVAGSGRTADEVAAALDGRTHDDRAERVAESGLVLAAAPDALEETLLDVLEEPS